MRPFLASLSRISDLAERTFTFEPVERRHWKTGDYVVGEMVSRHSRLSRVEMQSGRMSEVFSGDLVLGALGKRAATLEAVGDWELVGEHGLMQMLTAAGLLGAATSVSTLLPRLLTVGYRGHVHVDGRRVGMRDYVEPVERRDYRIPTILLSGSSMAAGKTTTAKIVVRALREAGLRVVGAKLTGAGRYRDILAMRDAGAHAVYDFVDVGLPSTVCPEDEFREALGQLLSRLAATDADVAVVEIGASPMEPYNGAAAVAALGDSVVFRILCASDPYAVLGVMEAFGMRPDLVTGVATATEAGIELIEKLTGIRATNVLAPGSRRLLGDLVHDVLPSLS